MRINIHGHASTSTYFDGLIEDMIKDINAKSNDYILNVDIAEWKEYFLNKYAFIPLEVYTHKATVKHLRKGKASREQFGRNYEIDTYVFELSVPFTGTSHLFTLRPMRSRMSHPSVEVTNSDSGFITSEFTMFDQNKQQFEYEKQHLLESISVNAPNVNFDLQQFTESIGRTFDLTYAQKKKKVLSENSFFENLDITIESNTDEIFNVPIIRKKKVPEPMVDSKSAKKYSQSPILPDKFYSDVLLTINGLYKAVEKKPSIYNEKDEEGLRDYILPFLELRYENTTVTGETFNKQGKTDILVRYKDNTNLFVAECKFWKGPKVLHETIHQLFDRYLTWRDSKVALIFFVQNKEFSAVLSTVRKEVSNHPYFVRENGSNGDSSFSYIFHFPDDKGKYIYTEIMAFHFP